jgi:hypothetical protein
MVLHNPPIINRFPPPQGRRAGLPTGVPAAVGVCLTDKRKRSLRQINKFLTKESV